MLDEWGFGGRHNTSSSSSSDSSSSSSSDDDRTFDSETGNETTEYGGNDE